MTRSLRAGDWDVQCVNTFNPAGTTTLTLLQTGVSTVSANFGSPNAGAFVLQQVNFITGGTQVQASPVVRVNVASTTTVYCVANAQFGVSTMTVDGSIRARRAR
ncbi:hypothetical protein C7415_102389 [Cupriavidus alkaliphilus]|nr:hypothetical protein C7415_102389 [Cupriavidus alkaliphilus]